MYHREAAQLSARGGDVYVSRLSNCQSTFPRENTPHLPAVTKRKTEKKISDNKNRAYICFPLIQLLCAAASAWSLSQASPRAVEMLTCACLHVLVTVSICLVGSPDSVNSFIPPPSCAITSIAHRQSLLLHKRMIPRHSVLFFRVPFGFQAKTPDQCEAQTV